MSPALPEIDDEEFRIDTLSPRYLETVDAVGRPYRKTLGFLPEEALTEHLQKGWVIGAIGEFDDLLGYLIFAQYPDRYRIVQLCVTDKSRGKGVARKLVEALKAKATTQKVMKLRCRRDYPAHSLWKHLGFIPLEERAGRSQAGHPITLWCYRLASDDELGLWAAEVTDTALDVVIDAQIFFDFGAEDSQSTLISKGLQADYLIDSLKFWITDELFLEIDRNDDPESRNRSMERAHGLPRVEHNSNRLQPIINNLKRILPYNTQSEKSDNHQLAKTACSSVSVFVTKDEKILRRADEIREACGLKVLHPVTLITSLHEEIQFQDFSPSYVSGLRLCWRAARDTDVESLTVPPFRNVGESKAKRREAILAAVANPTSCCTEVLFADDEPVAFRIFSQSQDGRFLVERADVAYTNRADLYANFIIADCLSEALSKGCELVEFSKTASPPLLAPVLARMEFHEIDGVFQRAALASISSREDAGSRIARLSPKLDVQLLSQNDGDFERSCAPLILRDHTPCYLIPIQPTFAMGLLDRLQSSDDLFGGDDTVLLRWDNVYYRRKHQHRMLTAPARILWYVSQQVGEIVAVSHLDEVEIGRPKDLFSKYRRFGVLEWKDIHRLCKGDLNREIMALKFSRTFSFKHRVSLSEIRTVFKRHGVGFSLQSPLRLSERVVEEFYQAGFPT